MSNSKKIEAQAVSVTAFYSLHLKQSIIHRREIVEYGVEGNKYLLSFGQKKGDWYYSDCIVMVYSNPEGNIFFGFARSTTGFPILQNIPPIFKRYLPIEEVKDVKINKDKELQILIQGYGDQSLWKFRFYVADMVEKWSNLLIKLRFHNPQKKGISEMLLDGETANSEEVKQQVVVRHQELQFTKQSTKSTQLIKSNSLFEEHKIQRKATKNSIDQADQLQLLYKYKIRQLEKERNQLKVQLQLKLQQMQPHSQILTSQPQQNQTVLQARILELQNQNKEIRLQLERSRKQREKIAAELLEQARLNKQTIAQILQSRVELLLQTEIKTKEKQEVIAQATLQVQTLKRKLSKTIIAKQQYQTKYTNLRRQSQAALAYQIQLLGHEKNRISKLSQQLQSKIQQFQAKDIKYNQQISILNQNLKMQEQKTVKDAQVIRNKDLQIQKLKSEQKKIQNKLKLYQKQIVSLQPQFESSKPSFRPQLKINANNSGDSNYQQTSIQIQSKEDPEKESQS